MTNLSKVVELKRYIRCIHTNREKDEYKGNNNNNNTKKKEVE